MKNRRRIATVVVVIIFIVTAISELKIAFLSIYWNLTAARYRSEVSESFSAQTNTEATGMSGPDVFLVGIWPIFQTSNVDFPGKYFIRALFVSVLAKRRLFSSIFLLSPLIIDRVKKKANFLQSLNNSAHKCCKAQLLCETNPFSLVRKWFNYIKELRV